MILLQIHTFFPFSHVFIFCFIRPIFPPLCTLLWQQWQGHAHLCGQGLKGLKLIVQTRFQNAAKFMYTFKATDHILRTVITFPIQITVIQERTNLVLEALGVTWYTSRFRRISPWTSRRTVNRYFCIMLPYRSGYNETSLHQNTRV